MDDPVLGDGDQDGIVVIKSPVEKEPVKAETVKKIEVVAPVYKAPEPVSLFTLPSPPAYEAPKLAPLAPEKKSYTETPDWLSSWMGGLS